MNAGSGDGMWETAEPPSAGNAWEQPKQGRKSRQEPPPEAVPVPAPAVAAPNADLAIPAAELAEILHEELEENFCCPLTLVCSHIHHSTATKPFRLCFIVCAAAATTLLLCVLLLCTIQLDMCLGPHSCATSGNPA